MSKQTKSEIEEQARLEIERIEREQENIQDEEQPTSLGNIKEIRPELFKDPANPETPKNELGWKNVPIESLPTSGMFYPTGTKIAIRAASVAEIRHWSTLDETDGYAIDEALNFIIERCVQIVIPGKRAYHKDLKEIDRFYLIFAIREFTFKNGENKLYTEVQSRGGQKNKIEVTKDVISYFKPDEKLMKFYSETERCFVFNLKSGETFSMHIPSIGVTSFLKNYRTQKQQLGQTVDEDFEKMALFLFGDWRQLTNAIFENEHQNSFGYSIEKISVISTVIDLIRDSVDPAITTEIEGEGEVHVPLNFQGGFKSLFIVPTVLDDLV